MARQQTDQSGKWLIQHHGDSILHLGGPLRIRRWKALQAELVQPRQLPDGLLEVYLEDRKQPNYFLLEIATFPEKRILEQVTDDLMLAYQQLRVLPDLLTVILAPRGQFRVGGTHQVQSELRWSHFGLTWKVVELWTLSAEELLAANEVGLVPWIPLTHFTGPPEHLLQRCAEMIGQLAPEQEQANLQAVSYVLASLRYNDPELLSLLGGKQAMTEFPAVQKFLAEKMHGWIQQLLEDRFGEVPREITSHVKRIQKEARLEDLLRCAGTCKDLEAFKTRLRG